MNFLGKKGTGKRMFEANEALLPLCLHKSGHFRTRQAQRKITDEEIAATVKWGTRFYEGADRVFFMRRRDIPAYVPPQRAQRLNGVTVIVSADGTLATTYRNPEYLRELKKRRA